MQLEFPNQHLGLGRKLVRVGVSKGHAVTYGSALGLGCLVLLLLFPRFLFKLLLHLGGLGGGHFNVGIRRLRTLIE